MCICDVCVYGAYVYMGRMSMRRIYIHTHTYIYTHTYTHTHTHTHTYKWVMGICDVCLWGLCFGRMGPVSVEVSREEQPCQRGDGGIGRQQSCEPDVL